MTERISRMVPAAELLRFSISATREFVQAARALCDQYGVVDKVRTLKSAHRAG